MEKRAMQFLNRMANHFFGDLFSWMFGQRLKDTLCGAKALRRDGYRKIAAEPRVFRRVRPVRRLRSAVRGGQAQPPDRRHSHPLPRAHLRQNQDPALEARLVAPADGFVADRKLKFT